MTTNKLQAFVIGQDPLFRRLIRLMLNSCGIDVFDGDSCPDPRLMTTFNIDMVILACGMAGADVVDSTRHIRGGSCVANLGVPIIVLTARQKEGERQHALDNGVDVFLPIPLSCRQLHAGIEMAMANARERIIPSPIDQNPCAHLRSPMDMITQG